MDTWEFRSIRCEGPHLGDNLSVLQAEGWDTVNFVVCEWSEDRSDEVLRPVVTKWIASAYRVLLKRRKPQDEDQDQD